MCFFMTIYYDFSSFADSLQLSFFVRKEIYQQRLNVIFQRLVDQGLIDYFERKVLHNLGAKDEKSSSSAAQDLQIPSVTFSELKFMLIVMLTGMFASIIIFIIEIFVSWAGKGSRK